MSDDGLQSQTPTIDLMLARQRRFEDRFETLAKGKGDHAVGDGRFGDCFYSVRCDRSPHRWAGIAHERGGKDRYSIFLRQLLADPANRDGTDPRCPGRPDHRRCNSQSAPDRCSPNAPMPLCAGVPSCLHDKVSMCRSDGVSLIGETPAGAYRLATAICFGATGGRDGCITRPRSSISTLAAG